MDIRTGIQRTAQALGINPLDLATAISYETGGTFNPTQAGPTTQWGQHRGLIQFGEPQAKRYGVDWNDPLGSQLGENGAVANYLRDTGVQPGMGLLDIYSAINAGGVGRYNASDANNGGAPGTVRDKVERQMSGHRRKAAELLNMPEAVASDTMRALGAAPQTQEQPMGLLSMSTQGQAPKPEKERWWTPDRRDRLVLGLEGMTLNPNRGLMLAASQGIQGRREDRKEQETQRKAEERRKRAAQWLASRPGGEIYAQAVLAGGDMKGALNGYLKTATSAGDPSVQSSAMLPDQSGTVMTMRDGSLKVVTVGGETLTGDTAMQHVRKAQEQAAELQRGIYSARREGTLGADIEMGGEAERAKAEGKMAPEIARSYLEQAELVGSTIRNLGSAIQAIDEGAQSGIVYNMLPNVTRASAELANAKQRLGLDVIGSVTFGALSEGEMKLAMDTAVPQNLGPKELREWLTQKREAQTKMHAALMEASAHFANGGTMAEYVRKVQGEQSGGGQSLSDDDLLRKYGGQ